MVKAYYHDVEIAASDETIVIEGNHYFPKEAFKKAFFSDSTHQTTCPWKGVASYYNVTAKGFTTDNAAWTYHEPKEAAVEIKDYIAFWKDVKVVED